MVATGVSLGLAVVVGLVVVVEGRDLQEMEG